jgi:serine/threonine protein kinase
LVKALELLRETVTCKAAAEMAAVDADRVVPLGEGTFGRVARKVHKHTGQTIVVKSLKEADTEAEREFLHEIAVLSRLCEHENVVELVDVDVEIHREAKKRRMSLVFNDCGVTLASLLKESGHIVEANCEHLFGQLCRGLEHLHSYLVIHCDLKPPNICVTPDKTLKIVDLGSAVISLPGYRSLRPREDLKANGLEYCTLCYRSIELLLGDSSFSMASDCWSLGCVLGEMMSGRGVFRAATASAVVFEIVQLLGYPEQEELDVLKCLPFWSPQIPKTSSTFDNVFGKLTPTKLVAILRKLLRYAWLTRFDAADCLRALGLALGEDVPLQSNAMHAPHEGFRKQLEGAAPPLLARERTVLALLTKSGESVFEGERGSFRVLQGHVGEDVLQWLREGIADSDWSLTAERPDRRLEAGFKMEQTGHLEVSAASRTNLSLYGKNPSSPMWPRWRAWNAAFVDINGDVLKDLQRKFRERLRQLPEDKIGLNGHAFLKETDDITSWFSSLGAFAVHKPDPAHTEDPPHFDGGGSFMHTGTTLYGCREIRLDYKLPDGTKSSVSLQATPGHFYFGPLTAAWHQVRHTADGGGLASLYSSKSIGCPVGVVLLSRSRIFRRSRGSVGGSEAEPKKGGPNPKITYMAVLEILCESLGSSRWVLPSLADCQKWEAKVGK